MSRKKNVFDIKLEPEEQEIEDALPDSWEDLPFSAHQERELAFAKEAAANYLRKEAKINIRLTHHDLEGLRRIAVKEGLPYQTLISSVLHKYVTHHLDLDKHL
jgi:predicted DNA binding CopG/RHH family protein